MGADGILVALRIVPPHRIEDVFLREDLVGIGQEQKEELEFLGGELHRLSLAGDGIRLLVYDDVAYGDLSLVGDPTAPKEGVYAPDELFEVDGFGGQNLMDDANVPSLLGLPFLGCVPLDDPIYQNTRRFVWSKANPYFFKGSAGEGIGGPHIGIDYIWPMSLVMLAHTSTDEKEIRYCIETIRDTDANTGFIHESFNKDNPDDYTRPWMAWANTLFGELIIKLQEDGRLKDLI